MRPLHWRVLVVVFVCSLLLVPVAQVSAKPSTTYINRLSYIQWTGTVSGAETIMYISNPGLSANPGTWARHIDLVATDLSTVAMGFEKFNTPGSTQYCSNYTIGLYMFIHFDIRSSGSKGNSCYPVPTSDINTSGLISISNDSSTGDVEFNAKGFPTDFGCQPKPCSLAFHNIFPTWNTINMVESIKNNVSGHNVWGVTWLSNEYLNSKGWTYQTNPGSFPGTGNPGNPPQMFWYVPPAPGDFGGALDSCVYETGINNCIQGQ